MGRKPFLYHPNPAGWNHPPTTGIACGFLSATKICPQWELGLSDDINVFPMKSAQVNDLPFSMRPEEPTYEGIAALAYKAPLNSDGIAVLPADWDDHGK